MTFLPKDTFIPRSKAELEGQVYVALGGRAAEEVGQVYVALGGRLAEEVGHWALFIWHCKDSFPCLSVWASFHRTTFTLVWLLLSFTHIRFSLEQKVWRQERQVIWKLPQESQCKHSIFFFVIVTILELWWHSTEWATLQYHFLSETKTCTRRG